MDKRRDDGVDVRAWIYAMLCVCVFRPHTHREKRKYLRTALKELAVVFTDQPGLLGPKVLSVVLLLMIVMMIVVNVNACIIIEIRMWALVCVNCPLLLSEILKV